MLSAVSIQFSFRKRHAGQRRVKMKRKLLFAPRLTVGQTDMLFGIAKEKFNLKPGFVISIDEQAIQVKIRGKQDDIVVRGLVLNVGDPQVPFQFRTVDNRAEDGDLLILIAGLEAGQIGVLAIHLPVVALGTSGTGRARARVEVPEIGILAEFC